MSWRHEVDGHWHAEEIEEVFDEPDWSSVPAAVAETRQNADGWTCQRCGKDVRFVGYARPGKWTEFVFAEIDRFLTPHPDHGIVSWWCSIGNDVDEENE